MKNKHFPKWVIVGLGNPEIKYKINRHNVGFICLDLLANKYKINFNFSIFNSLVGYGVICGQHCLFMKPQTYMNDSGTAVLQCLNHYNITPDHMLVIFDDISFSPGNLRIRKSGSSGGHKGINSIIEHLYSQEFPRIKIGVGQPQTNCSLKDWVVTNLNDEELVAIKAANEKACIAIEMILNGEIELAMSKFNHLL